MTVTFMFGKFHCLTEMVHYFIAVARDKEILKNSGMFLTSHLQF